MRVFHQAQEIDRPAWERIRDPHNLLTDPNYLQAIQESEVLACEYLFFEFYAREDMVCSLFGFITTNDAALSVGGLFNAALRPLRVKWPGLLKFVTLEIGSPVSVGLTLSTKSELTSAQMIEILALIKNYALKRNIHLILFRDFQKERIAFEGALQYVGFGQLTNLPLTEMQIVWSSFEDYLMDLKERYRSNIRRRIKLKEKSGVQTVFTNDQLALNYLAEYVELITNVMQRSKVFPREVIGEQYHLAMFKNLRDKSHWQLYFKDDRLVGFNHFIIHNDRLTGHYMGLDYRIAHDANLYFNALLDTIRFAIENNVRSFSAGVTTYQAKSTLGFSIYPERMYLWSQNAALRRFIPLAFNTFVRHDIHDCHYVFKDNKHQFLWDGKR